MGPYTRQPSCRSRWLSCQTGLKLLTAIATLLKLRLLGLGGTWARSLVLGLKKIEMRAQSLLRMSSLGNVSLLKVTGDTLIRDQRSLSLC